MEPETVDASKIKRVAERRIKNRNILSRILHDCICEACDKDDCILFKEKLNNHVSDCHGGNDCKIEDCFLIRDMIRHQLKRWEKVVNRPNGQLYQSCCNVCNPIYDAEPVLYKRALVVLARRHRFCQAYEELPYYDNAAWYLKLVEFCSDLQARVEKIDVPEITRKNFRKFHSAYKQRKWKSPFRLWESLNFVFAPNQPPEDMKHKLETLLHIEMEPTYDHHVCGICETHIENEYHLYRDLTSTYATGYIVCPAVLCLRTAEAELERPKSYAQEMVSQNRQIPETTCKKCRKRRQLHYSILSGHMEPGHFVCDDCRCEAAQSGQCPPPSVTSQALPCSHLSSYIENRTNEYIQDRRLNAIPITIRVVDNSKYNVANGDRHRRQIKVKIPIGDKKNSLGQVTFPYRNKTIFAFQPVAKATNSGEVCFFAFQVQEYDHECPSPNTSCIYLAYVDSVQYFEPAQHRTGVYHQILLSYLQFAANIGYKNAYIWSMPPSHPNRMYLFNGRPASQKIPDAARLCKWYETMLDNGEFVYRMLDRTTVTSPEFNPDVFGYFDECFWTECIDEVKSKRLCHTWLTALKEYYLQQDDEKMVYFKIDLKAEQSDQSSNPGSVGVYQVEIDEATSSLARPVESITLDLAIMQIDASNNSQSATYLLTEQEINDPDDEINCELISDRKFFVQTTRFRRLQFSRKQLAIYSTARLCNLMNSALPKQKCDGCGNLCIRLDSVHCELCQDLQLCPSCYYFRGNHYSLRHFSEEQLKERIAEIRHAAECPSVNCNQNRCASLKADFVHMLDCPIAKDCPTCRPIMVICVEHAINCNSTDGECPVNFPRCREIRFSKFVYQKQLRKPNRGR